MKLKKTLIIIGSSLILYQLYKIIKNTFNLNIDSKNMGKVEYILYYTGGLIGYNIFAIIGLFIIIIALKRKYN